MEEAAHAVHSADILLFATGAGWSADSGLAVYKDVADLKVYQDQHIGSRYLCDPDLLTKNPRMFYGFWMDCMNKYRATKPHEGHAVVKQWMDTRFSFHPILHRELCRLVSKCNPQMREHLQFSSMEIILELSNVFTPRTESYTSHTMHDQTVIVGLIRAYSGITYPLTSFYGYTSNVDHHLVESGIQPVYEIHGQVHQWQCRRGLKCTSTPAVWNSTKSESSVDPETLLFRGDLELLKCTMCSDRTRPNVLMFQDSCYVENDVAQRCFELWIRAITRVASWLKIVILEVGCGRTVTTVRDTTEEMYHRWARNDCTLIRVNANASDACISRCKKSISLVMSGKQAIFSLFKPI